MSHPPRLAFRLAVAAVAALALATPGAALERGDRGDRGEDRGSRGEDRIDRIERSERDADRAAERADRDFRRAEEDRIRDEIRGAEDRDRAAADAAEDAARAAEDQADDAADAAEDAADDAADAAEDAAREQAEAEEESAEAARRSAEAAGAPGLRELAASERPEFDREGYPVRRGEVVALDLDARTRDAALAQGFALIETQRIDAISSAVSRLRVPDGMTAAQGLERLRAIDPGGTFDLGHYYGLHYSVAGRLSATARGISATPPGRRPDSDLRVGMIDTAVAAHPALAGAAVEARDFAGAGRSDTSHGTAVASLLAADGARRILAAAVFRGDGGRHFTSADAVARGLGWLIGARVPVINISLAGPRNAILDRLIVRAVESGHVIVAAAGNGGPAAPPAYPAAVPGVVAVTAVDGRNRIYRYANRGPYVRVAALGVGVPAAAPGGGLGAHSGTSFAAPHVAALLARCARQVSARNSRCVAALERSAVDLGPPGRDPVYGFGLVR